MAEPCKYEAEIASIRAKINNIERILIGNGTKGLVRTMDEIKETVLTWKSYNRFKNWAMGSTIALFVGVCGFLLGWRFY